MAQAAWESGRFASLAELQDQLLPGLPPGAVERRARQDQWLTARAVRRNVSDHAVSVLQALQKDALGPVITKTMQVAGNNLAMVERMTALFQASQLQDLENQHRRGGEVHPMHLLAALTNLEKIGRTFKSSFDVLDTALGLSEAHRLRSKLVANSPPGETVGQGIQYEMMGE